MQKNGLIKIQADAPKDTSFLWFDILTHEIKEYKESLSSWVEFKGNEFTEAAIKSQIKVEIAESKLLEAKAHLNEFNVGSEYLEDSLGAIIAFKTRNLEVLKQHLND